MFADLNAVPIVLATQDPDEIVTTVRTISPGFGGIHLEDIASPGVFDIEARLDAALDIPVMHDDQHGTAVVVLAAVLRAAELAGHDPADLTFAQVGLGAAGSAIALLATAFPFAQVHAYDPVPEAGARLPALAGETPLSVVAGGPEEMRRVMDAGDVLAMTTGQAQLMDPAWVRPGQIILALSNPVPEIDRRVALDAGAAVATDGSIVNNVLAYPGLFKGAMDSAATSITLRMKGAAARTLASLAPDGALLPDPLDRSVHDAVASAVAEAAREAGAP
jgi:malate dehydrogenase (oxaloacetate-decarboxylating)